MSTVRIFNPPRDRSALAPSGIYRPSFVVGQTASRKVRDRLVELGIGHHRKATRRGEIALNGGHDVHGYSGHYQAPHRFSRFSRFNDAAAATAVEAPPSSPSAAAAQGQAAPQEKTSIMAVKNKSSRKARKARKTRRNSGSAVKSPAKKKAAKKSPEKKAAKKSPAKKRAKKTGTALQKAKRGAKKRGAKTKRANGKKSSGKRKGKGRGKKSSKSSSKKRPAGTALTKKISAACATKGTMISAKLADEILARSRKGALGKGKAVAEANKRLLPFIKGACGSPVKKSSGVSKSDMERAAKKMAKGRRTAKRTKTKNSASTSLIPLSRNKRHN
jgi:hypothetical protein